MIIVLFAGPTNFIMNYFTSTIGSYIQELPSMSFRLSPLDEGGINGFSHGQFSIGHGGLRGHRS